MVLGVCAAEPVLERSDFGENDIATRILQSVVISICRLPARGAQSGSAHAVSALKRQSHICSAHM
jgi:hypothetical protein